MQSNNRLWFVVISAAMIGCAANPHSGRGPEISLRGQTTGGSAGNDTVPVSTAAELMAPPGNLTITPDGQRILSLHQWYTPPRILAMMQGQGKETILTNYPASGEGILPSLSAVLGIRSDTAGLLYILDNGNSSKAPPKIVVWNSRTNSLTRTIPLRDVTDTNSLINDLAFDYRRNQLYISDPAGGPNAAIIVVNLATGTARRVLEGHSSVVPEQIDFDVEQLHIRRKLRDGTLQIPRTGVDGIGIDYQHEWVYFAPLHGTSMYRVRAEDLANPELSAQTLGGRVERYSSKPPSDGIALDSAGNIYLGDLPSNGIGVITTNRQYRTLAQSAQYQWVDDFEFSPDGMLYVVTTQLHRSPELHAGVRAAIPPFRIFQLRPLAPGRQGF